MMLRSLALGGATTALSSYAKTKGFTEFRYNEFGYNGQVLDGTC